jgi:hypothetical protein
MAKNSVSEWSTVSSGNGDIAGFTLGSDMPPSYVNNAIQEMMAQIKQWKDGYTDPDTGLPVYQSLTVENIDVKGVIKLNDNAGVDGQFMISKGASNPPVWGDLILGTMADQNNDNVSIDGGTITGTTIDGHTVGSNSTGNKFVSTANPSGGADGDIWYKI